MLVFILKIFLRRFQRYITHACSIKADKARLGLKIAKWAFSRKSLKKNGTMKTWSKNSEKKSANSLGHGSNMLRCSF